MEHFGHNKPNKHCKMKAKVSGLAHNIVKEFQGWVLTATACMLECLQEDRRWLLVFHFTKPKQQPFTGPLNFQLYSSGQKNYCPLHCIGNDSQHKSKKVKIPLPENFTKQS